LKKLNNKAKYCVIKDFFINNIVTSLYPHGGICFKMEQTHLHYLHGKLIRYNDHKKFLENCILFDVVPKGFTLKWRLNFGKGRKNEEICNLLKSTSTLLVKHALDACLEEIEPCEHTLE